MRALQCQIGVMLVLGVGLLNASDRRNAPVGEADRFRVESRVVLVPVSVTDRRDRPVLGLDSRNFRVFEGGVEQQVLRCSREDVPLAVGLIFDTSQSMAPKLRAARAAAAALLGSANPDDEFFLIEFQDRPQVTQPATQDPRDIQVRLAQASAHGHTALLDAVQLGVEELRKSSKPRKALVIVSDGGDNHSRYTAGELHSLLREGSVAVYAMGLFSNAPVFVAEEERDGPALLEDMTSRTGGRFVAVPDPGRLPEAAAAIGAELHNRYLLEYAPSGTASGGDYRKVQVKVVATEGLRAVHVASRPGYYIPAP